MTEDTASATPAVTFLVPNARRNKTGGDKKVQGSGTTIREVLNDLKTRYPGLTDDLLNDEGYVGRIALIFLNGDDIRLGDGAGTSVNNGDVISILPIVAGG